MDKLLVKGGNPLYGKIAISGAKNAALPLMTASLLTDDLLTLENLPELVDVFTLGKVLSHLGVDVSYKHDDAGVHQVNFQAKNPLNYEASYDLVRKMRASILVLGPLVTRLGQAKVSLPGGCAIGTRPIDLHLMALEKMGASIDLKEGYVHVRTKGRLRGANIRFPKVTVTGTENIIMAAVLAEGTTKLYNAACEPEVTDLVHCLVKMGAEIKGIGTSTLEITGVKSLHGATHRILPDRIETGTYAMAVGMTGGEIELVGTSLRLLPTVVDVLNRAGLELTETPDGFKVKSDKRITPVQVVTDPYPGYPTDLQAQLMALMCRAEGVSNISEAIFENRFMHVPELMRMGADILIQGHTATIMGGVPLKGAPVMATDLRASVSLVLAGLAAEGETMIHRVYHLDRGYEHIENKLGACGAQIKRIREDTVDDTSPSYPLKAAS